MEREMIRYWEGKTSHENASLTKWLTLALLKEKKIMRLAGIADIEDKTKWLTITDSHVRIRVERYVTSEEVMSAMRNCINHHKSVFWCGMFKKDEKAIYLDFAPPFKELMEKELKT